MFVKVSKHVFKVWLLVSLVIMASGLAKPPSEVNLVQTCRGRLNFQGSICAICSRGGDLRPICGPIYIKNPWSPKIFNP